MVWAIEFVDKGRFIVRIVRGEFRIIEAGGTLGILDSLSGQDEIRVQEE